MNPYEEEIECTELLKKLSTTSLFACIRMGIRVLLERTDCQHENAKFANEVFRKAMAEIDQKKKEFENS